VKLQGPGWEQWRSNTLPLVVTFSWCHVPNPAPDVMFSWCHVPNPAGKWL